MTNSKQAACCQAEDDYLGYGHYCIRFVTPFEESRDNGTVADDGHTGEYGHRYKIDEITFANELDPGPASGQMVQVQVIMVDCLKVFMYRLIP